MRIRKVAWCIVYTWTSLWCQSLPTDQIICPNAQLLPPFHANAQLGFVDVVSLGGWRPNLRFGLGGLADFEWTLTYMYTDIGADSYTMPAAGIKMRVPMKTPACALAVSLHNAQDWQHYDSDRMILSRNESYADAGLQSIRFESTHTRIDLLSSWMPTDRLRIYPSAYYLEAKTRDLSTQSSSDEGIQWYGSESVAKTGLIGFGFGFSFQIDSSFTYLGQWLSAPEFKYDVADQTVNLGRRHVFVVGIRYVFFSSFALDAGIHYDSDGLSLSDMRIYARASVMFDIRNRPKRPISQ